MGLDVILANARHASSGAVFEGQATVYADKFGNTKTLKPSKGCLELPEVATSGRLTSRFDDYRYYFGDTSS